MTKPVETPSLQEIELPPYYECTSMLMASVDLTDFGSSEKAVIKSPTGKFMRDMNAASKNGKESDLVDSHAQNFRAMLDSCPAIEGLCEAAPARGADIAEWKKWVDAIPWNVSKRLNDCCWLFMADRMTNEADDGDSGNASSPPSEG